MSSNAKPVRIVATPDDPYAVDCFDQFPEFCQSPGYEIEYMHTLINGLLGLQAKFVKVDTFEDIEKALDSDLADITGTSLMLDPSYFDRWLYTPIYLWDGVAFISKEHFETDFQSFALFDAFSIYLWLLIFVTTLLVVIIRWVSKKVQKVKRLTHMTYGTRKFRSHCFYAFWFIVLTVLLNFYSNLMVVQLMTPLQSSKTPFDSIPQLGKKLLRRECRLAILQKYQDDVEFHKTFINPDRENKNAWSKDYRDAFIINPPHYTASREETVQLVLNSTCVIGVDFATMESYYYSRFCKIRFASFPHELPLFGYVYYFTDVELARNISAVMTSDPVSAYPTFLADKYYFSNNPPNCGNPFKTRITDALPFAKFQGVFILYFSIIFLIGLFTFIQYLYARNSQKGIVMKILWKLTRPVSRQKMKLNLKKRDPKTSISSISIITVSSTNN